MKSHVSTLLEVVTCVYQDAVAKCTAVKFDMRDLNTIRSRVEHEGLSFLTITLPSFGQDFERCLAEECVDTSLFRSFAKSGAIPAFLQGMLCQVFDRTTGRLLHEPSIASVEGIRQLAYTFKKIEVACSPKRVSAAIDGFEQCEHDLGVTITPADEDYFRRVATVLWSGVFDPDILDLAIPKHGPGATCEGISGNRKYRHKRWHVRLEPYFPLLGTAYNIGAYPSAEFEDVEYVEATDEMPVKVITVPKTLKSPRIIAIEPVCMQYAQQALSREIVRSIERSWIARGHVNFSDQRVNRKMALNASKTGAFATLDLSSASDRVPRDLALDMFNQVPHLRGAIDACRSTRATLPNGKILPLRKFASMGSALCFPVESMYFYTICVAALLRKREAPVTPRNVYNVSRAVFVYGDDIIVPAHDAVVVTEHLVKYKCKVNATKSFWTGKFRESCGMDAFDGEEVTPTYLRQMTPCDQRSAKSIVSWVETANLFYKKGYWKTSSYLFQKVEGILGVLPRVGERCSGLGRVSYLGYYRGSKLCSKYHVPVVRTWVPVPVYRNDSLDGHAALTKSLLSLESRSNSYPSSTGDHLSRTARHGAVTLKRRWVPVV